MTGSATDRTKTVLPFFSDRATANEVLRNG